MPSPEDRRYTPTHEWHKREGGLVTIGLTQFAVDELTDITYVGIEKDSGPIAAGDSFGEIESVKATSELYCAIDGIVAQVNPDVIENPALVNQDPFGRGWLIKVEASDVSQVDALLSAPDYDQQHAVP